MISKDSFEINGLKEVGKALDTLPAGMKAQVLKSINRDVLGKILRPKVRTLPYKRKRLAISSNRQNKSEVILGIARTNYWLRFLDKGTVDRKTKKGHSRGSIIGNRMITNMITGSERELINMVTNEYGDLAIKHIDRRITSVNKRIQKLNQ